MRLITSDKFTGLFGSTELECAAALIINIARERGAKLTDLRLMRGDFAGPHMNGCQRYLEDSEELEGKPEGYRCSCGRGSDYTLDGFRELIEHGWLQQWTEDTYRPTFDFVRRIQRRLPDVVL